MKISNEISNDVKGINFMLIACLFYSLLNCMAKELTSTMHPMSMIFYRNFFAFLLMLPFARKDIKTFLAFKTFSKFNLYRGVLGFISMLAWFIGIAGMPMSDSVAISFLTPIIVSCLAVVVLKEKFSFKILIALMLGFGGVCVILNPNVYGINKFAIAVLISSFAWASSNIIVKKLTCVQTPLEIVFFMAFVITVATLPWVIYYQEIPKINDLLYMIVLAGLSNLAQMYIAKAYNITKVTIVIPFDFTRLIFSAIFAYLMFNETLKGNTTIGSIMIMLGGMLVMYNTTSKSIKSSRKKETQYIMKSGS